MSPADLAPLTPAVIALIKAIKDRGDDPAEVIPVITRSYAATGRADKAVADYIDKRFPES